jgi:hypothetical protein
MELDNAGLFADRRPDPARMDTVEFLHWLDEASEDELRAFGNGGTRTYLDNFDHYDVLTRTYINTRTGTRQCE